MLLKLITFNIRYDKPDPDDHNWKVRRKAIASVITHYSPDLIGTQEGKAHQLLDLHRMLPHYQSVGGDRTGTRSNEHCSIFYHSQRLNCLETGDFFLSETPEIPGSITESWGNPHPRMVTWAIFQGLDEPKKIILFNTHLDYYSEKARELGAKLIYERLSQLDVTDTYLFVTADFNATPETVTRKTFETPLPEGRQLDDALAQLPLEDQKSFNHFTEEATDAIDTIYYDSRVKLQNAFVDRQKWEGVIPSDHFPVIGEFLLES
ncbi:Endonuclease/exonuclease/phosphatase [Gloeothece citriformis PCC 7424]|uniref:Endonuclease/exonuclease/phosphatase n=1 Tax=Gloeothece citriformis (strain PCC 7424) TaxID=65393 RepID=B7KHL9_GLOC7|nr:endonuclease/exonuclease/phosphatase family protein [Gloeothece citriformis]ACK70714.1 Endonuclease/exonuclease/phosphatase [Gloeothece citriformis PCC 7424]